MRTTLLVLGLLVVLLLIPAVQADDANEWTVRGWAAISANQNTDALTYFNNALALEKNSASAWSGKSVALNAMGDYTSALDAATKAQAINANNEKALNARAYALLKLQRYNESATAYNTLFSVAQVNTADPYCNQGYAYWMQNKTDNAVTAYKKCISFNPVDIVMWNNLGLVYMAQGNYENAISAFDSGTSLTVVNATLWNNKGKALAALGRTSEALECFNKAIGIDPGFAEAQANKESMTGKFQTFQISETTVATQSTINRLGTYWTTAPPTEVPTDEVTAAATDVQAPEAAMTTTAAEKKTTYSPLSPLTALLALVAVAGAAVVRQGRK